MDALSLSWISAFLTSILVVNMQCFLIKSFISNQPSGHLSSFVGMVQDIFVAVQAHGTTHCILAIISRFDLVRNYLRGCSTLTLGIGTFVEIVNTSTLLHLGNSCIVRILCLNWISLMEETVGEFSTRIILVVVSISIGSANCIGLIYSGDILNGTIYNMITGQMVTSGNYELIR
jgi:hypothetical protein